VDEGLPFEMTLPPVASIGLAQTLFLLMGSVMVAVVEALQICWYWLVNVSDKSFCCG
jgi:hypothetical protein